MIKLLTRIAAVMSCRYNFFNEKREIYGRNNLPQRILSLLLACVLLLTCAPAASQKSSRGQP